MGAALQSSLGKGSQPSTTHPAQYLPDWAQCSQTHTELYIVITSCVMVIIIIIIINPGGLSPWKGIQTMQVGITSSSRDTGLLGRDEVGWDGRAWLALLRGDAWRREENGAVLHLQPL